MTDTQKLEVLRAAFAKACKFLRDNPPADGNVLFEDQRYLYAVCGGDTDPKGERWQKVFLDQVLQEKFETNQ